MSYRVFASPASSGATPLSSCSGTAAALLALLSSMTATAQTTDTGSATLQEIIVTANKRDEDIQTSAMAVSAISGQDIEEQSSDLLAQVAATVPGLAVTNGGQGQTRFAMRGLSTSGNNFLTQSPVGFYLDETAITLANVGFAGQFDPSFFDLARIEVLRGPQGTLYGAGSLGGAIRIITNQPDATKTDARVRASIASVDSGDPNYSADAMLNLPLIDDKLAWRTTTSFKHLGGFVDQTTPDGRQASNTNSQRTVNVRTALQWQPTESFTITPGLFYQDGSSRDQPAVDGLTDNMRHTAWDKQPGSDEVRLGSLNLRYDGDGYSVNSNNSYFYRFWALDKDYSDSLTWTVRPTYSTLHPANSPWTTRSETATSETRISSTGKGPLQWVGGIYYARQLNLQNQTMFIDGFSAASGGSSSGIPVINDEVFYGRTANNNTQKAVFGEISYELPSGLKFTVGGRQFAIDTYLSRALTGLIAGGTQASVRRSDATGFVPKYGLSYQIDDERMVYALASKGFRIGGPNVQIPFPLCADALAQYGITSPPDQFNPDSVWNYEVGAKTDWLDSRLRINASAYYIDWSEIQLNTALSCGYSFMSNVATAKSQGLELEASQLLGERWLMGGTMSFIDASYTSSLPAAGIREGSQLQGSPRRTGSAYLEFKSDLAEWDLSARGEFSYYGETQQSYSATALNPYVPSYELFNARLVMNKGPFSVSLYGNNLTNKVIYSQLAIFRNNYLGLVDAAMLPPRTIGISIEQHF